MGMFDDVDIFFSDDAVAAQIGGVEVEALFDEPTKIVDMFTGSVVSTAPSATIRASDADSTGAAYGEIVTIGATDYSIIEMQPAGPGMVKLSLTKDF